MTDPRDHQPHLDALRRYRVRPERDDSLAFIADQFHLDALRRYRVRPERDDSLAFIADQFQREVARPFKQLGTIARVWDELVPLNLARAARLESLQRGTLTVSVSTSAVLYELDRRLRDGLERELIIRHRGAAFRRVKLRLQAG